MVFKQECAGSDNTFGKELFLAVVLKELFFLIERIKGQVGPSRLQGRHEWEWSGMEAVEVKSG